jgi:iron(III) transport system permease protein
LAYGRWAFLAQQTISLVLGTLGCALPLGVLLAFLLTRTDLPGRSALYWLLVLTLFVPVPLFVSGWQAVRDALLDLFPAAEWSPWSLGMGSAIFLHSIAALPWVVLIVSRALEHGESAQSLGALEEDALTIRPAWWVLLFVSLPHCLPAMAMAALLVTLQTAGEITITDILQVRTFAEEVYTQLVAPEVDPTTAQDRTLAGAVVASLVTLLPIVLGMLFLAPSIERRLAAPADSGQHLTLPRRYALGRFRLLVTFFVAGLILVSLSVPVVGLVRRAGMSGEPLRWSLGHLFTQLSHSWAMERWLLFRSLLIAAVTGVIGVAIALPICITARGSRFFGGVALVVLVSLWATPGPVLGLGCKEIFRWIVDGTSSFSRLPADLLWYGPSSLPLILTQAVRFAPVAVAILWPEVRSISEELIDQTRLDGVELSVRLVLAMLARGCLRAALVVMILSLGELSAGKLVSTPGAESFAEVLWAQMHYGVTADLAARCLWLIVAVGGLGGIFRFFRL